MKFAIAALTIAVSSVAAQSLPPEQIALTLAALYPKGHGYRVSTETIYNCIYVPSLWVNSSASW